MNKKKATKRATASVAAPDETVVPSVPKVVEHKVDKEKAAALRNFIGQMKTQGAGLVVTANEATSTYGLRRPSGIMQLDIDCAGGLPSGGLSTLAGPDGAGKSELLYLYLAQHQRIYGDDSRLALCHTEGQFDFWRAKRMGLHIPIPPTLIEERRAIRAARGQPDLTKEEVAYLKFGIGDFVFIQPTVGEETLDAVLKAIESTAFGIVAIDSIQGLIPQADADKDLDENAKRAAFATLITRFMQRYIPMSAGLGTPNYTTLLVASQVRANPDKGTNPYAPDFIVQIARAMKHYHLLEVTLTTGQQIRKTIRGDQVTVGKEMKWKITKGKAGAHDNVHGSTSLIYPEYTAHKQSVDVIGSIIVSGMKYGVISEDNRGVAHVCRPSENHRQVLDPAPNISTLETMMRVDPGFEQLVRQEILLAANLDCRYR
jgi:RecA/RadA recombinase